MYTVHWVGVLRCIKYHCTAFIHDSHWQIISVSWLKQIRQKISSHGILFGSCVSTWSLLFISCTCMKYSLYATCSLSKLLEFISDQVGSQVMEDEQFSRLLAAIEESKQDIWGEISTRISTLVAAGQESSSEEVLKKISKQSYQFQQKGCEAQFCFNCSMEDHLEAAKMELSKLSPASETEKAIVHNTSTHLEEGTVSRSGRNTSVSWTALSMDGEPSKLIWKMRWQITPTMKREYIRTATKRISARRQAQLPRRGSSWAGIAVWWWCHHGWIKVLNHNLSGPRWLVHATDVVRWGIWWPAAESPEINNRILC